jgi:hypothetical protein
VRQADGEQLARLELAGGPLAGVLVPALASPALMQSGLCGDSASDIGSVGETRGARVDVVGQHGDAALTTEDLDGRLARRLALGDLHLCLLYSAVVIVGLDGEGQAASLIDALLVDFVVDDDLVCVCCQARKRGLSLPWTSFLLVLACEPITC